MSELILLCRPEEMDEARGFGCRAACAAWRVGDDGRLWRSPLPKLPRGSLMAVLGGKSSVRLQADIEAECSRLGMDEVLWLSEIAPPAGKGYRLYRPRSSAISGGDLAQYLKGAAEVFVEPLRHYFTLPDPSGNGAPISEQQLNNFRAAAGCRGYSRELGCKYLIWEGGCVLFDDTESIARKIELLGTLGVKRMILPFSSRRVRAFLRSRP